jgi:hypothetical protein
VLYQYAVHLYRCFAAEQQIPSLNPTHQLAKIASLPDAASYEFIYRRN